MRQHDAQKLWLQDTLNRHAIRKALEQIQSTGRALPCKVQSISGQVVTVSFAVESDVWTLPPVTIPVSTSIYDWLPIQPGDLGITFPADVNISQMTGLGSSPPTLGVNPGNLSSLVFIPVSNAIWSPPGGDARMRVSQGPDGFLGQTSDGQNGVKVVAGTITFLLGGVVIAYLNSTGFFLTGNMNISGNIDGGTSGSGTASFNGAVSTTGAITATGNVTAGSIDLETHVHTGVTTGAGNTGGPTG